MEEKVFHQRFVAKKLLKTADDYFQWLGEDMQTHKMVVIKEFNRQTPNQMAAKEFARECQLIHKISQIVNPNIARIYVIDLKIGYYVMEYVPGQNIHDYLVGNTIPEDLALRIIIKIANALHILYSKFQILHRDIQPCNIQLESGTLEPKIVDLGIVKSLNSAQLTMMNQVKGTFFYLAPELIYQDADYSIQSDMYGLGLTLFYLLQRTDLFEEPEHVLHFVQTGNVPDKFKQIQNRNLAKVLFKMIDRDPKKRFQSYPELLQALTALEASIRSTSPAVAPQQAQQAQQARLQQAQMQQTGFPRDQEFLQKNQQEVGKLKNTLQELIQYIKVLKDATLEFEGNNRNPQGLSPQSINILKHNLQQMNNFKQDINSFIQCIRNIKDRITALEQINGAIQ